MSEFTGIVLAGSRGAADALAGVWGDTHRAMVDVGGTPMLLRVIRALRRSKSVGPLHVSIDESSILEDHPELGPLVASGEIQIHPCASSPSRSVREILDTLEPGTRALLTTADHALLTPEMLDQFAAAATDAADVYVAMVTRTNLTRHYPESVRTYIPLRGEAYSGANLFAFCNDEARRAVDFWIRAETLRKRPWRLVATFGLTTLLLFALRRLDLEAAFTRASRVIGARVRATIMEQPEAAIDVDRPSDVATAEEILQAREGLG